MSKSKWNPETIAQEALKYKTRNEFQEGSSRAYKLAGPKGFNIRDDVCSHMDILRENWDKDSVLLEAKKYETLRDFREHSNKAYHYASRKNILDEVCEHLKSDRIKWSFDKVIEEALKYDKRDDFRLNSSGAYGYAQRHAFLDEVYKHIEATRHPKDYWTHDKMREEALKYKTRNEFSDKSSSAYSKACSEGIINDICGHMVTMKKVQNVFYCYKVDDTDIWKIGISNTQDVEKRIKSVLSQFLMEAPSSVYLWTGKNVRELETKLKRRYKSKNVSLQTFETLKLLGVEGTSSKIDGKTEFFHLSANDVDTIVEQACRFQLKKKNYSPELLLELQEQQVKLHQTWTYDLLRSEALKYQTHSEFRKHNKQAYDTASRKKILAEVCEHMGPIPALSHSLEEITRVAQSCKTYGEFYNNYSGFYKAAIRLEVISEVTRDLEKERKSKFDSEPEAPKFM